MCLCLSGLKDQKQWKHLNMHDCWKSTQKTYLATSDALLFYTIYTTCITYIVIKLAVLSVVYMPHTSISKPLEISMTSTNRHVIFLICNSSATSRPIKLLSVSKLTGLQQFRLWHLSINDLQIFSDNF